MLDTTKRLQTRSLTTRVCYLFRRQGSAAALMHEADMHGNRHSCHLGLIGHEHKAIGTGLSTLRTDAVTDAQSKPDV